MIEDESDVEGFDTRLQDESAVARARTATVELAETRGAFIALKAGMMEELIATPISADQKILRLHMALQMLDGVEKALLRVVEHGEIARQALAIETGLLRPH